MTSNEYPPPAENGDDASKNSESSPTEETPWGAPPARDTTAYEPVEPYSNVYEPVHPPADYPPAPASYPPAPAAPYGGYQPQDQTAAYQPQDQPAPHQPQNPPAEYPQQPYPAQQTPASGGVSSYGTYDTAAFGGYPAVGGGSGYPPADPPATDTGDGKPRRIGRVLLLTALIAALVGGGVGGGIVALADHNDGNSVNTGLKITNATGTPAAQTDGTVGAAAAKIRPSVVTINVSGSQESGTGSGIIIRADGYILTNDHVVAISSGTGQIQVVLSDGRTTTGKIVGRDTPDDLAVIKVDGLSNLTAATFAKSESVSVGQTVVAVGAPLGLSDTVTSGIVSTLARPVRAGDNDQAVFEAVQTDAAINPGNSGGPLVDLNGSVVGVNAAIASDSSGSGGLQIPGQAATQSGNIGIGFAIPADEASRIASELIATGKATHAVLGVSVSQPTATTSIATTGVPIAAVTAGGVGAKAGLKVGDIVTALDGQQVTTADALIAAVRNNAPGTQVKVTYTRSGKSSDVNVTLGSSDS